MASEAVVEFTDANFQNEVLDSDVPVLVDFWAEWCQPCKMLGPTIDKLADDYGGTVKIGKMDTDGNRETAVKYNISAIPSVLIFKGGEVQAQIVGMKGEGDYKAAIDKAMG